MIFILHIPKTGGTFLFQQLGVGQRILNLGPDEFTSWDDVCEHSTVAFRHYHQDVTSRVDVMRAHCDMTFVRHLPAGTKVITLLRDPLGRLQSLYRHSHRSGMYRRYAQTGFEDFIHADLPYRPCDNEMVRRLAGIYYQDVTPDHHHVTVALENLDHLFHVGFQGAMGKTIRILNDKLKRAMENAGHPFYDVSFHEELVARNELDFDLYIKAVGRYG